MKKIICCILVLFMFTVTSCEKIEEINELEAIETVRLFIESSESTEFIQTITNFDSPIIEKGSFNKKDVWKITFTTTLDALLGPVIIYIDYTGKILGQELRV